MTYSKQDQIEFLINHKLYEDHYLFKNIKIEAPVYNYEKNMIEVKISPNMVWRKNSKLKSRLEHNLVKEFDALCRIEGKSYFLPYAIFFDEVNAKEVINDFKFEAVISPISSKWVKKFKIDEPIYGINPVNATFSLYELKYVMINAASCLRAKEIFDVAHILYSENYMVRFVVHVKDSEITCIAATSFSELTFEELNVLSRGNKIKFFLNQPPAKFIAEPFVDYYTNSYSPI